MTLKWLIQNEGESHIKIQDTRTQDVRRIEQKISKVYLTNRMV